MTRKPDRIPPRRVTLLGLVVAFLCLTGTASAMINPAAGYCSALGYTYSNQPDSSGSMRGSCTLDDGNVVDAWRFLLGKEAQEYGYCSRMGYGTEIVRDPGACGIFNKPSCAACVFPNGSMMEVTQAMNLDFRERICLFSDTCVDPADHPPAPYFIPPSGGNAPGGDLFWPLLIGLLALAGTGAGLVFWKRKR